MASPTLTKPSAETIERARNMLRLTVLPMFSHDQAMDNLCYLDPTATPAIRLAALSAALYILQEADEKP